MSFLRKIKTAAAVINIKPAQEINSFKPNIIQEDQNETQTRRRVADHLEQNHELLLARGMRPHGFDCEDNQLCEKEDCWKLIPDQIVGEVYNVCKNCRKKNCGTPLKCLQELNARIIAQNKKT